MKTSYIFILSVVLSTIPFANAIENTNHTITSGTFGVAWLDSNGIVRVFDGQTVTEPVPKVKIYMAATADLLEEGSDQLLFLDDARKSLHLYSFKTKKLLGPFGNNIKTFATGQWSGEESFPSLFASTFSGNSFRWTKEVMEKGWLPVPGDFVQVTSGKLNPNNKFDDFIVVTDGNLYFFSPKWLTYSRGSMDDNIVALLTGNFTDSPADDIIVSDRLGFTYLCLLQNHTVESLTAQKVSCMTLGKNGENLDSLYALDNRKKPIVYNRESKSWKDVPFQNAFSCTDIITRTDSDGKGHELFVVGNENLYQIAADGTVKQLSDQKASKIMLKSGDKIIADYRFGNVPFKPYIEKLRTLSGRNILRDAPYDHLHHHGLMFAIAVNGCNFWEESSPKYGKQITVSINPQPEVETSSLESELDWKNGDSKTLIKEHRKISVSAEENVTLLDWQTTLNAGEHGVNLDKSNHHYFGLGLRFDQTMDKNGRFFSDSTSNKFDVVRGDERLTECKWMAYTAKLNGEPVTVAVFGHPSNPIPTMAFTMGDSGKSFAYLGITLNLHRQPVEMKPNSSLTFRYRVAVWDGEVTPETVSKFGTSGL
ncbi:MAG: PmoA family protein [Planctomycetaceae bacterium]|nr:PmoA family protein [Planctomycetaceae bacterium]